MPRLNTGGRAGLTLAATLAMIAVAGPVLGDTPPVQPTISAEQLPVWVEHDGARSSLRPGDHVGGGDALLTGPGARVYVDLPDGSTVKLGASGRLELPELKMMTPAEMHDEAMAQSQGKAPPVPDLDMSAQPAANSVFRGVIDLVQGVFRFTTRLADKQRARRVTLRVGVATVGIRGTDVWGRADATGSLVALLEGKVSMSMPGHPVEMMDTAMHYMEMPTQGQMIKAAVTQANVAAWVPQTDIRKGGGVLVPDGAWSVCLSSRRDAAAAARFAASLRKAGYPAQVAAAEVDGVNWHRVIIRQLASLADARALGGQLEGVQGVHGAWVLRQGL